MFIDTHCHLQFEQFNEDRKAVLQHAINSGVSQFIVPAVDPLSCKLSLELTKTHEGIIFSSVGYHPYEASHQPDVAYLEALIAHHRPSIVAIGEIGLDYHLFKGEEARGKKQEQRMFFEEQVLLAIRHNLPVIMHCRDAYEDFFSVLDSLPSMPKGVIHCFSGGLQELRFAKERNFFVGIDGNITYAKNLQSNLPEIPLSNMLLETDAPYLTPTPHRGQRNEPKYIPVIADFIASKLQIDVKRIAEQTTLNAKALFTI